MLALILTILKIIGIVILVILGLILLLLAAILFVPVRYRLNGAYQQEDGDGPKAVGQLKWLFGFLRARFQYGKDGMQYTVKILSFTLFSDQKRPKQKKAKSERASRKLTKKKRSQERKPEETKQATERSQTEENDQAAKEGQREEEQTQDRTIQEKIEDLVEEKLGSGPKEQQKNSGPQPQKRTQKEKAKGLFEKLRQMVDHFKAFPEKVKKGVSKAFATFKRTEHKLTKVSKFLKDPGLKRLIGKVLDDLKKLVKHIRPKEFQVSASFGADNPAVTGQVTAIVAAITGLFGLSGVEYRPDFENKTLVVRGLLRGKVRLIWLAIFAIRLLTDQDFKRIVLKKNTNTKNKGRETAASRA